MMFVQNLREAIELFGPDSMNVAKLKQRYSAVIKEDFDTWFLDEQKMQQNMMEMNEAAMAEKGGGLKAPMKPGVQARPSLKTVLQAA